MGEKKPESYQEAQENLKVAFKELGKSLDESFEITPTVLGVNKRVGWIQRKIAILKFKRSNKGKSEK